MTSNFWHCDFKDFILAFLVDFVLISHLHGHYRSKDITQPRFHEYWIKITDDINTIDNLLTITISLYNRECAKFNGLRGIVCPVGLVPSCDCAFVDISWVRNFFSWVLRGSKIFSREYFVRPKYFLVGISWVRYVFSWLISWFKDFLLLAACERMTEIHKYFWNHAYSRSISAIVSPVYIRKVLKC